MKSGRCNVTRRAFIEGSVAGSAALGLGGAIFAPETLKAELGNTARVKTCLAQCPYCGVGCGSVIKYEADSGRILGVVPDKQHPTNKGIQCIKGLNADEPVYIDRLKKVLIRKDMSDPISGHVSKTKGSFKDSDFEEVTYEEAEHIVADKIAAIHKKWNGNAIGLYGSGQLTVETQWIENKMLKGMLASNSIEANARTCMTSAVTAYFATFGSDTPPLCYDDIEEADMISFWGHNPRAAHTIVFWRVADHKLKKGIPTLIADPRRTGSVQALESINPENSYHFPTINGDISCLNAIGHCLVTEHQDVIDYDFLKANVVGWQDYIKMVTEDYAPEAVVDRTGVDPAHIHKVAAEWADASRKGKRRGRGGVLTMWGIGYNQHIHGQHNVISIINLHALTGDLGRPGCGPFSMTGQPNAMGERFTGGLTGRLPFNQGLASAGNLNMKAIEQVAKAWNCPPENLVEVASRKNPGMMVGQFERALMDQETLDRNGLDPMKAMFYCYTTHIHQPDVNNLIRPALEKMFVVVQDIYRHAPNLLYGDVIFPALTWGEWQGGTYISSERRFNVVDGVGKGAPGYEECLPDLDLAIDKGKSIAKAMGMSDEEVKKMWPYKKKQYHPQGPLLYDSEEVFEEIVRGSKGADCDLTGMLEVRDRDGIGLYDQIRRLRGVQWPAPTYAHAKAGGTPRRYMGQEGWDDKPYGNFRKPDGKLHMKSCKQDYTERDAVIADLRKMGTDPNYFASDHKDVLIKARDMALPPEWPDEDFRGRRWDAVPKDKFPLWLGLGIVYEHFHSAKTIRGATTRRLVPEQFVEIHAEDAKELGVNDGDMVRIVTRRGSYEGRVSVGGIHSKVRPARNEVPRGYIFSPWNLSVADSADPEKNKWMVNAASHRAYDPVSGQVDFKKLAARIERV
ncbi:MAG: molybdopterin-dependent oxidoreductase [Verrucomicrobia bacterium]|jgi:anaerobic selenocysteine-containing dehydrogenase|nr:molybdopterin-dependent oxidoreductase [Verrucomicrobiota bacterium]MBT7065275.1 molybdopterin-dependent oxidoreductase [Verrucomicrobiota bacterium]MBT7700226.1 molybdopterin-dependent oxidoreductase [Verrucomicrobiota bacterium]